MALETYLVEHYWPGLDRMILWRAVVAIRRAAWLHELERGTVRYVRSSIVPRDEAFVSVFEAESEQSVRETYASAGFVFERISRAIQEQVRSPKSELR
jgi:hypothetical protein